jgi:hypothetical protein
MARLASHPIALQRTQRKNRRDEGRRVRRAVHASSISSGRRTRYWKSGARRVTRTHTGKQLHEIDFTEQETMVSLKYTAVLNWRSREIIFAPLLFHETVPNGFLQLYVRWECCRAGTRCILTSWTMGNGRVPYNTNPLFWTNWCPFFVNFTSTRPVFPNRW